MITLIKWVPVDTSTVKSNYLFKLLFFLHYCHRYQLLPPDYFTFLQHAPRIFTSPPSKGYLRSFHLSLLTLIPRSKIQRRDGWIAGWMDKQIYVKSLFLKSNCFLTFQGLLKPLLVVSR